MAENYHNNPGREHDPHDAVRWVEVFNAGNADLPPAGLLCVTGYDSDGVAQVKAPTQNSQAGLLVNGEVTLRAGEYGQAHNQFPASAAYQTADGTPAAGDEWGSLAGDPLLRKGQAGFVFQEAPQAGFGYGVVMPRAGGGDSTVLAVLIAKTLALNPDGTALIVYTGVRVADALGTSPITYTESSVISPIYHEQHIDLPVTPPYDVDLSGTGSPGDRDTGTGTGTPEEKGFGPGVIAPPYSVVRLRQGQDGQGTYWLISSGYEPRWEILIVSPDAAPILGPDGVTYLPASVLHYDQVGKTAVRGENALLVDYSDLV